MNRSIALFVALATLLAHVLAIHVDADGNFAFPYEQAYTAFRLGKSLVQDGVVQWGTDGGGLEGYTSLLWIGLAALGEQFTNHVNFVCQTTAIFSGLGIVLLLARFRKERSAGLIAPLLFVCCGSVAAACGSGLETTFLVLCLVLAFYALEAEHPWIALPALVLLVLARADGVLYAALLFLVALASGAKLRGWRLCLPFACAALAFLAQALAWKQSSGNAWHPSLRALAEPHPGQSADGLGTLLDFVRINPSPLLLCFSVLCMLRGKFSALGWRALALTLGSTLLVVLGGRSPLPFGQAFLPALPFLFLAVQEGLIEILDARTSLRRAGLASLLLVLVCCGLASKEPDDVGPLRIGRWLDAWMETNRSAEAGYDEPLARAGLVEEIRNTNRLRAVGIFLRDHVDPSSTCLSPWPSAIAYLAHIEVADLLARTNPMQATPERGAWTRRERGDVLAALQEQRDFIVPRLRYSAHPPSRTELANEWASELDLQGNTPERVRAIEQALGNYELITVPIQGYVRGPVQPKAEPFHLLRHRRNQKHPTLTLDVDGRTLAIRVHDVDHDQLVELRLRALNAAGTVRWIRPTGELSERPVVARSGVQLFDSGQRPIELMRWTIPDEVTRVEAVLVNPGAASDDSFSLASPAALWTR